MTLLLHNQLFKQIEIVDFYQTAPEADQPAYGLLYALKWI